MPKRSGVPAHEKQYTPEFKMQVVVEYVGSPRRKKRIIKERGITEELLDQWHQQFLARADQIFGESARPPISATPQPTVRETVPDPPSVIEPALASRQSSWGIELIRSWPETYSSRSTSKISPFWLKWLVERGAGRRQGIVLWDSIAEKAAFLEGEEALGLLSRLREFSQWRAEGIPITHVVTRLTIPSGGKPRRLSKKTAQAELGASENQTNSEVVEVEQFRLKPEAGSEIIAFLEQHESLLMQMADEDDKYRRKILAQVYEEILSWSPPSEEGEVKKTNHAGK